MKQSATLDRIQGNMHAGVLTAGGFLGDETRLLIEILDEDAARVRRLGLTHEAIAARMRELRQAGAQGLGDDIAVPPHFEVRVESVRGKLACPFDHRGLYQKTNIVVQNRALGRGVAFTDLSIHMISRHGFYEGRGSPFRLDPETLATVLEIAPLTESP